MADNYIQDCLKRVAAMEVEAMASFGTIDAKNYWPWQQESFPYFVNRLAEMTVEYDRLGAAIPVYVMRINMTLVIDHITAGYKGEKADLAYQYIVAVEDYFRAHDYLATAAGGSYPNAPDYLLEGAWLTSHSGLVVTDNAGIGVLQYAVVFTLEVPYLRRQY